MAQEGPVTTRAAAPAKGEDPVPMSPPTSFSGWEPKRLWHATDAGAYEECAFAEGFDSRSDGRSLIAADLDGDGDLDLLMLSRAGQRLQLFENVGSGGNAVELDLRPHAGTREPDGVQVRAAGLGLFTSTLARGFASSVPPTVHLGLGARPSVDVEVRWRDGAREHHVLKAGARYTVEQGQPPRAQPFAPKSTAPAPSWPATLEGLGLPNEPTLVQLFTRGCKPCAREVPALKKLKRRVVALGVVADNDTVEAAAKSLGITYEAHPLPEAAADALSAGGALTLPLLLEYGADGRLQRVLTGPEHLD